MKVSKVKQPQGAVKQVAMDTFMASNTDSKTLFVKEEDMIPLEPDDDKCKKKTEQLPAKEDKPLKDKRQCSERQSKSKKSNIKCHIRL